jgi:hypothetical protein
MIPVLIDIHGAGIHTIVPATPGRKIRVLNYLITSQQDTVVLFTGESMGLTGQLALVKGHPISAMAGQLYPSGALMLFQTNTSEPLNMVVASENSIVGGHLVYILVD